MVHRPANGDGYRKGILALHDYAKRAVRAAIVEQSIELFPLSRFFIGQGYFVNN